MRLWAGATASISCLLTACVLAMPGPSTAVPTGATPGPPDSVITPAHPPVQGPPGKVPNLPCGVAGPALALGDGSHYDSGRGTLRAAMLFVDFSDAPADASASPQEVYDRLVPEAAARLSALSYGRLRLRVTPDLRWVRMPKPLSAYGLQGTDPQDRTHHRRYIRDAIRAADPSFDFSKFKTVYVMSGPGVEKRGGTANYEPGTGVKADGTRIEHAMTLNGYGDSINPSIVVHETGHVMGLPDLYDTGRRADWDRYVGPWDVMSNAYKTTSMLAWTRRLVGWLADRDFHCVRKQATVQLAPVDAAGGTKGAVVRTGRRRAYVVEAHSATDTQDCADSGVLVYRVNENTATGSGPDRVIDAEPGVGACGTHTGALFKPAGAGDAHFEDSHVEVTVLGQSRDGFRVRVRVVPQ